MFIVEKVTVTFFASALSVVLKEYFDGNFIRISDKVIEIGSFSDKS